MTRHERWQHREEPGPHWNSTYLNQTKPAYAPQPNHQTTQSLADLRKEREAAERLHELKSLPSLASDVLSYSSQQPAGEAHPGQEQRAKWEGLHTSSGSNVWEGRCFHRQVKTSSTGWEGKFKYGLLSPFLKGSNACWCQKCLFFCVYFHPVDVKLQAVRRNLGQVRRREIYWVHVGSQILIADVRGHLPYSGEALCENTLKRAGWPRRCACWYWGHAYTPEGAEQRGAIQRLPTFCTYVESARCWGRCCPEGTRGALCVLRVPERIWHFYSTKTQDKRERSPGDYQSICTVSCLCPIHVLPRRRKLIGVRNNAFGAGSTKGAMMGKSRRGELSFKCLAKSCINKQVCTR